MPRVFKKITKIKRIKKNYFDDLTKLYFFWPSSFVLTPPSLENLLFRLDLSHLLTVKFDGKNSALEQVSLRPVSVITLISDEQEHIFKKNSELLVLKPRTFW